MKYGDRVVELGPLDADQTVRLIKLVARVYDEIDEDQKQSLIEGLERNALKSFVNVLGTDHVYTLTSVLLRISKKEAKENWTLAAFTELIAELSEQNDLKEVIKNLQRAVAAFRS